MSSPSWPPAPLPARRLTGRRGKPTLRPPAHRGLRPGGRARLPGSESIGKAVFELEAISAIETQNGLNFDEENKKALEAALTLNLPTTRGSDCHKKSQVGRYITEFKRPIHDLDGLVEEIKAGRCRGIKNPYWRETP